MQLCLFSYPKSYSAGIVYMLMYTLNIEEQGRISEFVAFQKFVVAETAV